MSADTTRRNLLAGAAAAGMGLDLVPFVRPARATPSLSAEAAERQGRIDMAVREVDAARRSFEEAAAQHEASLPALHPSLIWRKNGPLPHALCAIERRCDADVVERGLDFLGGPGARYIAHPYLIAAEIDRPAYAGGRGWRRFLRQALKRARRYRVRLARAEMPVAKAAAEMDSAKRRVDEIAAQILETPASTSADLAVKAHALVAFCAVDGEQWRQSRAGVFGAQLAREMLALAGKPASAPATPLYPDAALLALREPYERTLAEMDAEADRHSPFEDALFEAQQLYPNRDREQLAHDVGFDEADARYVERVDANMAAIQAIIDVPARTIDGLKLKARVSQREANLIPELVEGIITDLLAMSVG